MILIKLIDNAIIEINENKKKSGNNYIFANITTNHDLHCCLDGQHSQGSPFCPCKIIFILKLNINSERECLFI